MNYNFENMEMEITTENITLKREKFFSELYEEAFPRVAKFVSTHRGTFQDAKDIFQDSLIVFYEKSVDKNLNISASRSSYILGIAKHLWIHKFNRDKHLVELSEFESQIIIPENLYPEIQSNKLLNFLERTGEKCLEILKAFYYDKMSMREITDQFGYRNEHTTTVQKFKCLEKIRDTIKEKSISYEDFTK